MTSISWVLVVQLWLNEPPKIINIYYKEYKNYEECFSARDAWISTPFQVLCLQKVN